TKGNNHLEIMTNVLTIAAGPRILSSTMGAVGENGDIVNNTRATDGTPIAKSFVVTFDRPIDKDTFGLDDATVTFRDPNTPGTAAGVNIPIVAVNPVATSEIIDPLSQRSLGFTQFQVDFAPSTAVGTYSYTVG